MLLIKLQLKHMKIPKTYYSIDCMTKNMTKINEIDAKQ